MKKFILLMLLICAVFMTGCKEKTSTELEYYSLNDALEKGAGVYILNPDNSVSPLNQSSEIIDNGEESSNFFWWTSDKEKLTPELTRDSKLIIIADNQEEQPDNYVLERFQYLGNTVGGNIRIGEDYNSLWLDTRSTCPNSSLANSIDTSSTDEEIEICSINGDDNLPFSNIDTDINVMLGLEKNKNYEFTVFMGTRTLTAPILSDTQIFKSRGYIDINANPIIKTSKQYFIVNLPKDLEKGYYCMNGEGIFKVTENIE